ncbi:MAG TPA: DUF4197 domain-containing protein [Bacteroidales bacterium]|nr:DUF4197 domain-containing protein [Bacteroidales bacterium]
MKRSFKITLIALLAIIWTICSAMTGCQPLVSTPMSEAEVARGLREALSIGAVNAVLATNKENGYFGNPAIKIPFPEEAAAAMNFMQNSVILRPLLNEFILKMNRAAEQASAKAKPIFADAVAGITLHEAWNILRGGQNAATTYLRHQTYSQLYESFQPDVLGSLNEVGAQKAWHDLTNAYNAMVAFTPGLRRVNTDLAGYVTTKALDGLFLMVAEEEAKIRRDPAARVTDLLRRVFAQQ